MRFVQAVILAMVIAASLWLLAQEGVVSAIAFFLFGIVVAGAFGFALQIGDAAGGFIDRFIRRHSRDR
jgi:hypothetical protein